MKMNQGSTNSKPKSNPFEAKCKPKEKSVDNKLKGYHFS